jgi:hypothetical protein
MTLTVEDGSVVANADSYVTLAAYQSYGTARGWTLRDTDAEDEIDLRRAFDTINRNWAYLGTRTSASTQVGAWPRYIVGLSASDEIPTDIKNAQMELAYQIKGGLDPFETFDGTIKSAGAGPARVEYLGGSGRPSITAVNGLLRPYLAYGSGQAPVSRG